MSKCILVCSGDLVVPQIPVGEGDLVIACDAGVLYCEALSIKPHILIGDMDSLDEDDYRRVRALFGREMTFEEAVSVPLHTEESFILRLPVEKNDTDTLAAVRYALAKGFTDIHIYAGTGGYLDHTLANISTLHYIATEGGRGYIWDEGGMMTVIHNTDIAFKDTMEGRISVFPIGGPARGVGISGLYYEVEDADLDPVFPIGVSNSFIGKESRISVREGSLLIIMYWE